MTTQFSSVQQENFWAGVNGAFKGEQSAATLLRLADRFVGLKAVDLGAGTGALLRAFQKRYRASKTIVGVDLTPKDPSVLKADITSLPFESAEFDTVFATDVIEHLSDKHLDSALAELHRILRAGGHAILTTLNHEYLETSEVTCPDCGLRFHRWGHCQVFTRTRLYSLLENKGFKVVAFRTLNFGSYAFYPLLTKIVYALGIDRVFKVLPWRSDIFIVARKVP